MEHIYAIDCHTHSSCSHDGRDPIPAMFSRAKELGLYALTLTDHCECNKYEDRDRAQSQNAWEEMEAAAQHCPEGLKFLKGVELGQPMQYWAGAQEVCKRPYDFIIGSLHNPAGEVDFCYRGYDEMSDEEIHGLLTRYFDEIIEMAEQAEFDSLGHLTYPLRYIVGDYGRSVEMERYCGAIDKIFETLIRREKALEVNTSGFRQKLGKTLPDGPLLARYRALGGRLVTIGSDSHTCADLGKGIDAGMEVLKSAGFTELALYEKRQPVMLPIR